MNKKWDISHKVQKQYRTSFKEMQKALTNKALSVSSIRLLYCYIFSSLFYGMQAWALAETMVRRMEGFKMWAFRRLLQLSYIDRVANKAILQWINKKGDVLNTYSEEHWNTLPT